MKQRYLFVSVLASAIAALAWAGPSSPPEGGKVPITTSSEEAKSEFLKGRTFADNLQLTNSLEHFDRAIELDPNFASAYLNRAAASGTAKEFFDYLHNAVEHASSASEGERLLILAAEAATSGNMAGQKEHLEKAVAAYPKDERVHVALGNFYFAQQNYKGAIDQFKRSIDLAPEFAGAYNILGYSYRQVENYTEAEKIFKKYTELIPDDPNPHDSYAELLLKMGKFDESITNYQKALAVDPNFVASYSGIAMDYMQKGMPEKAEEAFDQLTMKARNNGERRLALFGKMVLAADAGKFERALEVLDKEYALSEQDHDASQMATDLVFRGNIMVEMGKFDDAGSSYAKSLEIIDASGLSQKVKDNAHLVQHFNLVGMYVGKNDLKSAKAEAEQYRKGAIAKNNLNQIRFAHELAGVIALAEKNYTNAIAELKQASLQNPQNLYRLGVAYAGKGEKAKAKEFFAKAAHFNGLPALNYAFVRAKSLKMLDGIS